MSAPTEKHRQIAQDILYSACLPEPMYVAGVVSAIQRDVIDALAAAEERGMKRGLERAAEIARAEANGRRKQSDDKSRFNSFERRDFDSMAIACHQVAAAITNEIPPSARSSSRASEAGSSDTSTGDPAPIHDEVSK